MSGKGEWERFRELEAEITRLRRVNRFLDAVVEHIPQSIVVKDARDLRFVRCNRAAEDLLGYGRSELLGRTDADVFAAREAASFRATDCQALRSGAAVDIPAETVHTRGRGKRALRTRKIPIADADGRPLFLLGIWEDATDSNATGAHHRELIRRFPGAVWTADANLIFTATAGTCAVALDLEEAVWGQSVLDHQIARPPDAERVHRRALAGHPGNYELRANGNTYEVRVERLSAVGGDGVIGVALDVTEHRRQEAERLQSQLQQTQKLELLGVLAGGIAHDFNNLLTSLMGNASLALMEMAQGAPGRALVERIEETSERAAELTRQLLAYSGKGRFLVQAVDLSELVQEMASLLRVSISKKAQLTFELVDDLPAAEVDVAQIRQLVMNLITNAADAVGDRTGVITLATGLVQADRDYLIDGYLAESLPAGPYVWIEVQDTGVGMDQATQERMFDPFFTTKTRGHGLGLAATLGIVHGHKGALRVHSRPGKGTRIRVLFPASDAVVMEPLRADVSRPWPKFNGRILVVDDESDVRVFAAEALEHAGFEVLQAADGATAVTVYQDHGEEILAVLLDMTMPHMSGEQAFRELRRLNPRVRVILSTGHDQMETASRFANHGRVEFLQKPYRAADLIAAVETMVKRQTN